MPPSYILGDLSLRCLVHWFSQLSLTFNIFFSLWKVFKMSSLIYIISLALAFKSWPGQMSSVNFWKKYLVLLVFIIMYDIWGIIYFGFSPYGCAVFPTPFIKALFSPSFSDLLPQQTLCCHVCVDLVWPLCFASMVHSPRMYFGSFVLGVLICFTVEQD